MIERYQNKLCASGTIVWTVTSPQDSMKVKTDLQYLSPAKVFINQQSIGGAQSKRKFLISDGQRFVYQIKNTDKVHSNSDTFTEPIREPRTGKLLTKDEVYIIGAKGLLDNYIPLDIVMGRPDNLAHLDRLIAKGLQDGGRADVNGQTCRVLKGRLSTKYDEVPSIDFTVSISAENDLVQMQTVERYKVDNGQTVAILMTWDVNVKVNDEKAVKTSLFKLPKTN